MNNPLIFITDMLAAAKKSYQAAVEERKKREHNAERKRIAKHFNNYYTYRHRFDTSSDERLDGTGMWGFTPKKGNAWMCPTCNKIHLASSCSAFSGLQYPHCCEYRSHHRLYNDIRTQ